jgi:predicted DNA-binding transcriptional regulator YafY
MRETSGRLLRLLALLQSQRSWTGTELAVRPSVSARTVRNDVERLRALGYPVLATRGTVGGYRLGAGAAIPAPVRGRMVSDCGPDQCLADRAESSR